MAARTARGAPSRGPAPARAGARTGPPPAGAAVALTGVRWDRLGRLALLCVLVALLGRVIDALVAELRRRLGGRFYAQELVELYGRGTGWYLPVAMKVAPDDPWAWESGVVLDAAFGRYLREAADYGGGRREPPGS